MEKESSISIINKNNGSLTGENANALPIKLIPNISWIRYILIGVIITAFLFFVILYTAQTQVAVVEVTGKAEDFKILQIN